jgi:two-component system, chemotaxis family, sensor kinase CheA
MVPSPNLTVSFWEPILNTSEYKDVFLNEAREYLSNLNNSLVLLEKDPSQIEAIREIFRAAHTLKGMSATMGYDPMVRLTHQMEAVLEPIRSGTQSLSTRLVDILFVCLDRLAKWVDILAHQDFIEEEGLQSTLQLLANVGKEGSSGSSSIGAAEVSATGMSLAFSESEREVLSQARMNGFSIVKVIVELSPDCVFKEVRAFMVLKNINELGEIVKSIPAPEDIEKGRFSKGFVLVVVTDSGSDKLREAVIGVAEVAAVEVENFKPEEAAATPTTGQASAASTGQGIPQTPGSVLAPEERNFILPTIRVHTSKLDKLMALVQELVISKIRFEQVAHNKALKELSDPLSQLHHITDELQDEITKVRLMPVKQIFDRFPRMVRDLARNLNKQVDLEMDGAEVELDRTVLEEMSEPLVHLLRNAVDHGIEDPETRAMEGKDPHGTIRLQAKRERSQVVISISDDGRGIDPEVVRQKAVSKGLVAADDVAKLSDDEVVRLISLPGFSTVENATEISGRGVGVDVAKTKVEAVGGVFRIQSKKGQGTTFILRFPLTLAIIKALLVKCNGEVFAIPVVNIIETVDVAPSEKRQIQQQEAVIVREDIIPLYPLQELLELPNLYKPRDDSGLETVLIAEVGESRVALRVDEVVGQQEIAIKPLDRLLKGIRGFSGATILGSGKIALILDVNSLVEDLKDKRFQAEHSLLEKDDMNVVKP